MYNFDVYIHMYEVHTKFHNSYSNIISGYRRKGIIMSYSITLIKKVFDKKETWECAIKMMI